MRASAILRLRALCTLAALLACAAPTFAQAPAIEAGVAHTCALRGGGTAVCWGWDLYGQLGDGSTKVDQPTPVAVQAVGGGGPLTGVTAITAGGYHTCALVEGGTAVCWGAGNRGQLGDGSTKVDQPTPVVVQAVSGGGPLTGVTAITAGHEHTCALLEGSTAVCWGAGWSGRLGDGVTRDDESNAPLRTQPTPVVVQAVGGGGMLTGITEIDAGYAHTCALVEGGAAVCWGWNLNRQLGDGSTKEGQPTPVAVLDVRSGGQLSGLTNLSMGYFHSCALLGGGAVCWGFNSRGQLGGYDLLVRAANGSPLTGVTAITAGSEHTCALVEGGTAVCWGSGENGQRGDGTRRVAVGRAEVAVRAVGGVGVLTGVTEIDAGFAHTCALLEGGTAVCWGAGWSGQLGHGIAPSEALTPVAVVFGSVYVYGPPEILPGGHALAVHPNPARTAAIATLALPQSGHARVSLHDALGREVALVFDGHAQPSQPLALDVSKLAPGVYVVRAVAGRTAITRTLVVAR